MVKQYLPKKRQTPQLILILITTIILGIIPPLVGGLVFQQVNNIVLPLIAEYSTDVLTVLTAYTLQILVNQGIFMIGLGGLFLWVTGRRFDYVNFETRRPTRHELNWIVYTPTMLFVGTIAISTLMNMLGGPSGAEHTAQSTGEQVPVLFVFLFIASVVIIAPAEEFLYRGIIQTRLQDVFSPIGTITASTLIFTFVHIPAYSEGTISQIAASLAPLAVIGLGLAVAYEKTENLTVVIGIHALLNMMTFASWLIHG